MAPQTLRRTDAALASDLRIAVMRLRRRLAAERAPENDLSLAAMAVLGLLFRADGQSVGDLARAERVQPPSMTRTVTALEAEGLVRRCPHATDGRQVLVELTAAGRARVLADRRERDAWLTRRLGELTPDERRLLAAVTPVLDRLAQAD